MRQKFSSKSSVCVLMTFWSKFEFLMKSNFAFVHSSKHVPSKNQFSKVPFIWKQDGGAGNFVNFELLKIRKEIWRSNITRDWFLWVGFYEKFEAKTVIYPKGPKISSK